MLDYPTKFVAAALSQVGTPYLWGARGFKQWSGSGPITLTQKAFDCSGLVLFAAMQAGSKDRTMLENAQTMFKELPEPGLASAPHLRFYGDGPEQITHVAVGFYVHGAGGLLVVEAAGGGRTTLTLEIAKTQGACVRCGEERRTDLVGVRRLPFW